MAVTESDFVGMNIVEGLVMKLGRVQRRQQRRYKFCVEQLLRPCTIFCFFDPTVWLLFGQRSKAIVVVHGQGQKRVTKTSNKEIYQVS